MIKVIEVNRERRHLAVEHDGVRFDWTGPAAMAIIALVDKMAAEAYRAQSSDDFMERVGYAIGQAARAK